jgi:hypothetical protein
VNAPASTVSGAADHSLPNFQAPAVGQSFYLVQNGIGGHGHIRAVIFDGDRVLAKVALPSDPLVPRAVYPGSSLRYRMELCVNGSFVPITAPINSSIASYNGQTAFWTETYGSELTKPDPTNILFSVSWRWLYPPFADDATIRLRKVALASTDSRFLQAYSSVGATGELHASNAKINQEETWWLYKTGNIASHQVALANYRNNYFLSRHSGGATNHNAGAVDHDLGGASTWTMILGTDYGLAGDIIALRANDGSYLKAYGEGHNADGEPGEVYVDMSGPSPDRNWNGWWRIGEVTWEPQTGTDPWTEMGDGVNTFFRWLGYALEFTFGGSGSPNNIPPAGPAVSCTNLPPVRQSTTARRVHAYCEGVSPSDFSWTFYPEDDPYSNLRVECDIQEHHRTQPNHYVIHQACDIGMTTVPGCEDVQ